MLGDLLMEMLWLLLEIFVNVEVKCVEVLQKLEYAFVFFKVCIGN